MPKCSFIPVYPLNQYVQFIWVEDQAELKLESTHHAHLFCELIFNYGEDFNVGGENTESFQNTSDQHIVSGLKKKPFLTSVAGRHLNVGIILKPKLYGYLLSKFASKEFSELSEIVYDSLIVCDQPDFEKLSKHLINFFSKFSFDPELEKFEKFISRETSRDGYHKDFNDSINLSQKTFINRFKQNYHVTPREFVLLKQTNYAATLINIYPNSTLTEIGLEAGFYDQSHFIRNFKKHYGYTPKQFRKMENYASVNSVQF